MSTRRTSSPDSRIRQGFPEVSRHEERLDAFMFLSVVDTSDKWYESLRGFQAEASFLLRHPSWPDCTMFRSIYSGLPLRVSVYAPMVLGRNYGGAGYLRGIDCRRLTLHCPQCELRKNDVFLRAGVSCSVTRVQFALPPMKDPHGWYVDDWGDVFGLLTPVAVHNSEIDDFGWVKLENEGRTAEGILLASPEELREISDLRLTY